MATLRSKRKLAAVTTETQEEHPSNGQSRNTADPRINEEYITQISEEIESRVTKRLSQEFSRTESCILGALFKLDEFLLNPQIRTHSGTVPGTQTWKTKNQMSIVPRMILMLKWEPPSIRPVIQMTQNQTRLLTVFQRCFRENQRWGLGFSAVFRAESALFIDCQVMNGAETDLEFF